jgi:DnaJ like chaperone protein
MAGWNGKIMGGALGALVGGPVGLVLGALFGHQYDSHATARGGSGSVHRVQQLFFPATFRLMGHIAKADGRVSEQEIAAARALMQALRLTPAQSAEAIVQYTAGKQPGFELRTALAPLRAVLAAYPQLAQFFIELQLQVAIVGNGLAPASQAQLRAAALMLGIDTRHYAQLEALMRWRAGAQSGAGASRAGQRRHDAVADAEQLRQAYALLDVDASAADAAVVKAWRRQMSRHHPDKLQANGLPESMLERAKERTQQIQAAYELIRAVRGMKA